MRVRERHEEPWRSKYGILFDFFHALECRLARLFSQHDDEPAFYDSWGCPYWLCVGDSYWSVFSYRRKVGDVGISRGEDGELTIEDIEIHEPRDRDLGLGSFLLKQVLAYARENGITRIVGSVTKDDLLANPKLIEWYQGFGFRVERIAQRDDGAVAIILKDLAT